jgi:hypothetical protein
MLSRSMYRWMTSGPELCVMSILKLVYALTISSGDEPLCAPRAGPLVCKRSVRSNSVRSKMMFFLKTQSYVLTYDASKVSRSRASVSFMYALTLAASVKSG